LFAANGGENVETVAVGQPDVEEHGLVVGVAEKLEGFGGGASRGDDVILFTEDGFEGFSNIGSIVNDQNMVQAEIPSGACGD